VPMEEPPASAGSAPPNLRQSSINKLKTKETDGFTPEDQSRFNPVLNTLDAELRKDPMRHQKRSSFIKMIARGESLLRKLRRVSGLDVESAPTEDEHDDNNGSVAGGEPIEVIDEEHAVEHGSASSSAAAGGARRTGTADKDSTLHELPKDKL